MCKLFLLMISILLVCLFSTVVPLHSQQQKPHVDNEVATPVIEDELTPQQKEHSKLYEPYDRGRRKLRDEILETNKGVTWYRFPGLTNVGLPGRRVPLVNELEGKSDTIVIATVISKSSQITANGNYIFTDYQLQIEEVLKNVASGFLKPESSITVTRPGGKVLLYGHIATFTDLTFNPLSPGRRYLLFLKYLPSTGTYESTSHGGTFDVSDTRVETLTEAVDCQQFERDLAAFITSVKVAIADGKKEGGTQ